VQVLEALKPNRPLEIRPDAAVRNRVRLAPHVRLETGSVAPTADPDHLARISV
jgi:hypothetical protein